MTDDANDLAEFLLARIAEDEERGRSLVAQWSDVGNACQSCGTDGARVLAECEAKRRIVADATQGGDCQGHPGSYQPHGEYGPGYCRDFSDNQYLRLLALPYADHPDYSEEWQQ